MDIATHQLRQLNTKPPSRYRLGSRFSLLLLSLMATIILHKNVFNDSADPAGAFAASRAAYIVAGSIIAFVIANIALNIRSRFSFPGIVMLAFLFYGWAFVLSPASALPLLSAFRALSGLGFVVLAALIGTSLARAPLPKGLTRFYHIILCAMIAVIIGTLMFNIFVRHAPNPLLLRAGIGALFALYLALWHTIAFTRRRHKKDLSLALMFLALGLYLNSFSSVVAFALALLALLLLSGRYILFLLTSFALVAAGIGFFLYLHANIDAVIFNKPARVFLIGTGRFAIYEYALQVYRELPLARQLFGVGFMAEREYFTGSSLSWTINVHNSYLSNLVGSGVVGFSLSLLFTIAPFLSFKKLRNRLGKEVALKWISLHTLFLGFGFTSIDYPSQPSWQILFFLIFTTMLVRQVGGPKADNTGGKP